MNSDEHRDRLVDSLLWELVGKETPPDLRGRVLEAVEDEFPAAETAAVPPAPEPIPANVSVLPVAETVPRQPAPWRAPARRARPSKLPALAAAAVVTLLGAAAALLYFQEISTARTPVLASISGMADRPTGPIPEGGRVNIDSGSSAVITYPDGTVLELSEATALVVSKRSPWDRSKGIEVLTGRLSAEVMPQPEGSPMVLSSKDARAEIVGTKLSIQIDDDRTRLEVTEGAVRFVSRTGGKDVLVKTGLFAEAGDAGFRTGAIHVPPVRGITGFMLMNAETDQPMRDEGLADGETISLSALQTRKINLRADYEGAPPTTVNFNITRDDGNTTGVPTYATTGQKTPPFFMAGDHWAEGRPHDCRAWTPRPGLYRFTAEARYAEGDREITTKPLVIELRITE